MSGPPRKPTELKRLQGNPGGKRLPKASEVAILEPTNNVPPPISLGPVGREVWRTAHQVAVWMSKLDLPLLEDLCKQWDLIHLMQLSIDEDGIQLSEPICTSSGHVVGERKVPNKMLKELRETQAGVQKLATALGFDPGSRSRLGLAEVKARNELEDLIARRNVN